MKKWMKVCTIVFAAIICVIGVVMCAFKYFVIPRYVPSIIKKAEIILNDEVIRKNIDEFVTELRTEGVLADEEISGYLAYTQSKNGQHAQAYIPNNKPSNDTRIKTEVDVAEEERRPKKTDTERVMEAMTTAELSFALSLAEKLDVNKMTSLLKTNRQEAKKYIKAHLTGDEIAKALEIYSKYSYLLQK